MLDAGLIAELAQRVGPAQIRQDETTCREYGTDALLRGAPADVVVFPGSTREVSAVARLCDERRIPLTPRGAGTGYTGGAVPTSGGVVIALDRLDQIRLIDEANLLAVVEPNVVTGVLQAAVEQRGLFYPPDPASLNRSVIGGNVAECAGGPRAFKYGTTRRYVLGLEAVLPTGEIVRTGGKVVKNVVGYDLTQLLVGSEGTLAIITEVTLRLIPKPPARATLLASFPSIAHAVAAVSSVVAERVVPAVLELLDRACVDAIADATGTQIGATDAGALLLIEVDGFAESVAIESDSVSRICTQQGALDVAHAANDDDRERLWTVRRDLSLALRAQAPVKINHDVVVPRARVPELFTVVQEIGASLGLRMPSFGHVGDGNIHVNILIDPGEVGATERATQAERRLFEAVVSLEGSISGEHGIGFAKAAYLGLELSPDVIALMRRVKRAFDPHGILNPGKIFPSVPESADHTTGSSRSATSGSE